MHRHVSSTECRQIGVATKNHEAQHYEPEKRSVNGIPKRLLHRRHTCRAESDQRTSRADVQELSQRQTLGVGGTHAMMTRIAVMAAVKARKNGNHAARCGVAAPRKSITGKCHIPHKTPSNTAARNGENL